MAKEITGFLAELYAETVTIEPYTGQDAFGAETYGSGVSRNCHIEGQSRLVRDPAGQERVSTVQVYLDGAYTVNEKDRITLPVRFNPQQPPIISVDRMADENGAHHEVVMC